MVGSGHRAIKGRTSGRHLTPRKDGGYQLSGALAPTLYEVGTLREYARRLLTGANRRKPPLS